MMLKKKNATPGMVRHYEILRRLYLGDKTVNDLVSEINNIPRKTIVQDLGKLLTKHAIKKIYFTEERLELTENQIAKDFVGVKDKQFIKYHLTEHGKKN
jgi:hypothetical protein